MYFWSFYRVGCIVW